MSRTFHIAAGKVSRSAAGFTAIIAILFLIFGVIFFSVVLSDTPTSEGGLRLLQIALLVIWTVACLGSAFVSLRIFIKGRDAAEASLFDVEDDAGGAFDVRLRRLESLRREGLIAESEYQVKRAQLLEEKW